VAFVAAGSLTGVTVASVEKVSGGEEVAYSVDPLVLVDEYLVV
jgi:hypothetical protein